MKPERVAANSLDQAVPIGPQLYSLLREAIVRNEFAPGNRISESEIAKACGVSRQPAREAFIRLADEGLLAVLPQRGTIISKINYTAVVDARFLREAIEADIVAILAANPDAALTRELRNQIKAQQDVANSNKMRFSKLDDLFHKTLAAGAGKSSVWQQIQGLKSQMDRVRFLSLSQFPVKKLVEQHEAIIRAIEAGDLPAANRAIRGHLREVLTDLPQILAASPEFFELPDAGSRAPVNTPIKGGD